MCRDPARFRANLRAVRDHFSSSLVRPVHEALAERCARCLTLFRDMFVTRDTNHRVYGARFVTEHVLQHGDVLLQLVFQDNLSRRLVINAKHIVYRRWRWV